MPSCGNGTCAPGVFVWADYPRVTSRGLSMALVNGRVLEQQIARIEEHLAKLSDSACATIASCLLSPCV